MELGGAWRLERSDGLRILNRFAVFQVGRDASGPEGVAASGGGETGCPSLTRDHGQHFVPAQRCVCQCAVPVARRTIRYGTGASSSGAGQWYGVRLASLVCMTRTKVTDRRLDPLPTPSTRSRAARSASVSSGTGFEGATWSPEDEPWLTGLEARLASSDTLEKAPDPRVSVEHWLAGLEAADQQRAVNEESPSTAGCSAPVESRSATAWTAAPEDPPTPSESRPEMDDWLDSMEDVLAVVRDRRGAPSKRRAFDAATARTDEPHPDEPGAAAPHDDQPAPVPTLAEHVARLGDMDVALSRVKVSLANSDAAFTRVVSRWHPVAMPAGGGGYWRRGASRPS